MSGSCALVTGASNGTGNLNQNLVLPSSGSSAVYTIVGNIASNAVALIGGGLVDVSPLISATLPFTRATEAFELAMDRGQSMKVQLSF